MPRWRSWGSDEDGSAALEFIAVGVILLVPLVYLIAVLGAIQEQTFGAEAAARHAARVIATAPDGETAAARADEVLAAVVEEYGMDAGTVDVTLTCAPVAAPCPSAGATIRVTVSARVRMPLVPDLFGLGEATGIPVEEEAVQKISRAWGSG